MMFLGSLGQLIEIKCPTSLQDSRSGGFAFSTTLEGNVKAQVLPGGRRTWDVGLGQLTKPDDLQNLEQFSHGVWGVGPFVFVSADAPVTNLLTPAAAESDPTAGMQSSASVDGPLLTPDGWAARSTRSNDTSHPLWFGTEFTPVVPGQRVTGAAYVLGAGARVRLHWYDHSGGSLGTHTSSVAASDSEVVRSYITARPPEGAVSCRLRAVDAVQAAWPTVTWTDDLKPRSPGNGCNRAVVHSVSKNVERATDAQQFYSAGFTVTEVG